jgi:hypothetical protein
MPAPTDDTVRIGRHPGIQNLRFIAGASAGVGAALGAPASIPFAALGLGDWSWPLGVLAVWVVFGGGIALGVALAYDVIEFDPRERTATMRRRTLSFRRRTVPLDTITEAWRSLSSAPNGAGYLVYRFVSSDGATSRVLVQGRPMTGLDAHGLRDLAGFVGELPLEVPDAAARPARIGDGRGAADPPALTERQRATAVSLTEGGGKSRVGRETLLTELHALIDAAEAADSPYPSGADGAAGSRGPAAQATRRQRGGIRGLIAAIKAERLERAWEEDDAEALELLASSVSPAARRRSLFLRLLVGCIGTGLAVVAVAIVLDAIDTTILRASGEDLVFLLVASAIVLSIAFYLAWCAAADADVRSRRDLARRWMAQRDDDERERGMATPLLLAWGEQAWRLRLSLAFIVCLVGATAIIAAYFVFSETGLPLLTSIGVLVSGLALEVAGVATFTSVTRRRRAEAEEMVHLGGRRLLPPEDLR